MTDQTKERRAYTAGLRKLADWLDAHPDEPQPLRDSVRFYQFNDRRAAAGLAAFVELVGADHVTKVNTAGGVGQTLTVHGRIDGLTATYCVKVADVGAKQGTIQRTITEPAWVVPDFLNPVTA